MPAYTTSLGRAILADLPEARAKEALAGGEAEADSRRTVMDPELFRAEPDRVRTAGYTLVEGELEQGLRSIAVPVPTGMDGPWPRWTSPCTTAAAPPRHPRRGTARTARESDPRRGGPGHRGPLSQGAAELNRPAHPGCFNQQDSTGVTAAPPNHARTTPLEQPPSQPRRGHRGAPGTNSMVGMRTPVSTADLLSRIRRM
ncbi:IclR family transcriptional regulator C-terminal domain-containing protein [Streptomyces sp. NPDC048404]|uniref:IclR family transcriptional regulator domain-containing protein n=1 Tax=unclassified Streptomyces TaxID=2593676 RepID=UPI0034335F17